jgi:hypothetical protein
MVLFFLCTLLCLWDFPGRWTFTAPRCVGRIVVFSNWGCICSFYGSSIVGSGDYISLYVFSVDFFYIFFTFIVGRVLCSVCWMCVVLFYFHCHYYFYFYFIFIAIIIFIFISLTYNFILCRFTILTKRIRWEQWLPFIYNCDYTWRWPPWVAETCCLS